MKKFTIYLLLLTGYINSYSQGVYNPQKAGAGVVYNAPLAISGLPLDARSYYYDVTKKILRPYVSPAEVLLRFDANSRQGQFNIVINNAGVLSPYGYITGGVNEEWWFKNGVADSNLVQKSYTGSSNTMVYAADVFSGKSIPQHIGSLLYNIIDDKTGEIVTYKEITNYANNMPLTSDNADGVLVRKVNGKYYMLTKDRLTTKDFGATGNGNTDDYAALQNAINVTSRWGLTLYVPAGTYLHSKTLVLPYTYLFAKTGNPWFTLKMIGDGQQVSIFKFTGQHDTCFKIEGGAGKFGGGGLYDLAIDGINQTNIGLYISERGNFQTFNCSFNNLDVAVLLQNTHVGSFTESVVQNSPIFNNSHTFLEYKVTGNGTDESFNGSGINGGYGNVSAVDNYPIKVDGGALPYNAPLSMEVWFYNNAENPVKTLIHNVSGSSGVNFYGHITVESFYYQGIHPTSPNQLSDGSTVTFCGTVNSYLPLSPGRLRITNAFVLGGQGIRDVTSPSPRTFKGVMHNGYFITENNMTENISTNSTMMRLSLQCAGFKAEYLLLLTSKNDNHSENGSMIKLATIFYETSIGFKEPIIILDPNGYLVIQGSGADGVSPYNVDVNIQANVLPLTEAFEQVVGDVY